MASSKILEIVKGNKWIIIAVIFFLVWKIFLTSLLWQDRTHPPEPDDSYIYITHIESVIRCPSLIFCSDTVYTLNDYSGFDHLTYRLFLGVIAKIFNLSSVSAFELGFYIGPFALVTSLAILLRQITSNQKLVAFSLLFLALYNGTGSYHGFFWVVPSYFSAIFFFLLVALLLNKSLSTKSWIIYATLLIPLAIFTHIISFYYLLLFPVIFFFVNYIIKRRPDWLVMKKALFIAITTLAIYLPVSAHTTHLGGGVPYGHRLAVESAGTNYSQAIKTDTKQTPAPILPGLSRVKADYFDWIFFRWVGIVAFILAIASLIAVGQWTIIAVYSATLVFTLLASINQFGFRVLVLLWPITYLLYALGGWAALTIIASRPGKSTTRAGLSLIWFLAMLVFIVVNMIFSLDWHSKLSARHDPEITQEATNFFYSLGPGETIDFDSEIIPLLLDLKHYPALHTNPDNTIPTYYCTINNPDPKATDWKELILTSVAGKVIKFMPDNDTSDKAIPGGFSAVAEFGDVTCYSSH